MSRIDELIKEHCPDGVEFRKLSSVTYSIKTGLNPRKNFKLNTSDAKNFYVTVKEITTGKIKFSDKTDKINDDALKAIQLRSNLKINDILFSGIGTIGKVALVDISIENWNCSESVFVIKPNQEKIAPKFLMYILASDVAKNQYLGQSVGSTLKGVRTATLSSVKIPLPPLPVQQEIVAILDKFTKLEAEVEAELEARQKQYAYYRDALLSFNEIGRNPEKKSSFVRMNRIDELIKEHCPDGVEYKELQEIFETKNGYTPSRSNKNFWVNGAIPWFRMDDIRKNGTVLNESLQKITADAVKGSQLFPANSIIIATSATIGEHALIKVPHLSNQRFTSLSPKPEFSKKLDMRFVYYYCFVLDNWCLANTTTSSFSSVNMAGFKRFKFPLPPLPVQQEIVSILDKFDALVNDISIGLPAEIAARRKQYEHYRNRLLTFTELTTDRHRQS